MWGARTYVMGVINVTPDSFSRDGVGDDVDAAVRQALRFQAWGADIVDVGGESTRPPSVYPGAGPVTASDEGNQGRGACPEELERSTKVVKPPPLPIERQSLRPQCWQPAKAGHFETREIRCRMEIW